MKLAASWLESDPQKGEIRLGIWMGRRIGRQIRLVHKGAPNTRWLQLLKRFCDGEWIAQDKVDGPSLSRIQNFLLRLNENGGTSFVLETRCRRRRKSAEIGLIGG